MVLALAAAVVIGALLAADRAGRSNPGRILAIEPATSFCGEFRGRAFSLTVDDVDSTTPDLRPAVAQMEAGFLGQVERLPHVPEDVRPLLHDLARELTDGAGTGEFDPARRTATALDVIGEQRCR